MRSDLDNFKKKVISNFNDIVKSITEQHGRLPNDIMNEIEMMLLTIQKEPWEQEHLYELIRFGIQLQLEYPTIQNTYYQENFH